MNHLSEEQMLALLRGALEGEVRDQAKEHLSACPACAEALTREARLDEVLWQAQEEAGAPRRSERPAKPRRSVRPVKRRSAVGWLLGGTAGLVTATTLGQAWLSDISPAGVASASKLDGLRYLFAWQNLIFHIPLTIGLLLVLGSAFGGHHDDAGHDHDAEGHDHDGLFGKALSVLGVGRVPLTIVFMIASLVFGGLGMIINTILSAAGLAPWFYAPISLGVAFVGMLLLTGSAAKLLDRVMPTTETYLVSRHDFAGCTGTLLLGADATSGYAQVKDPEGNVHNIRCRTLKGALPKGAEILIVEYDERTSTYVIDANPVLDR